MTGKPKRKQPPASTSATASANNSSRHASATSNLAPEEVDTDEKPTIPIGSLPPLPSTIPVHGEEQGEELKDEKMEEADQGEPEAEDLPPPARSTGRKEKEKSKPPNSTGSATNSSSKKPVSSSSASAGAGKKPVSGASAPPPGEERSPSPQAQGKRSLRGSTRQAAVIAKGKSKSHLVQMVPEPESEEEEEEEDEEDEGGVTRCVCLEDTDELSSGLMIQCDTCKCWQHGPCVGLWAEKDCPDRYFCELCKPSWHGPGGILRKAHRKATPSSSHHAHSHPAPAPQPTPAPSSHHHQSQTHSSPPPSSPPAPPQKKRSTMNSRDAAYDDAIAMSILGPGSAAMRARFAEGEEATGKDGKDGSGGGGNKGKGKRKGKVEKEEEDEKDDLPTATANTTGASTNNSTTATAFPSRGDRSRRSISRNHSVVIEDEGAGDQSSSSGNGGGKKRKISPPSLSADEISGSRGDETGDRDLVEEVGEKMDVDQPTVPSTSASASTSKSNSVSGGGAGGGRKSGTVTPAVPMGGGGQEEEGEGQGEGMDVDREDLTMDDDGAMEGAEKEENIGTGEEEDGTDSTVPPSTKEASPLSLPTPAPAPRAKHPNQYTYRPKNGPTAPKTGRASPTKKASGGTAGGSGTGSGTGTPAEGTVSAGNGNGNGGSKSHHGKSHHSKMTEKERMERDFPEQGPVGWGLPDHLRHLAHLLPTPLPVPLVVPSSSTSTSNSASASTSTMEEPPTRVKFPNKRMTVPEMKKRARNVLEYLSKVQIEMSEKKVGAGESQELGQGEGGESWEMMDRLSKELILFQQNF